jgi:hypothetical protein
MSGDATLSNTGALTIANNAITIAKIANTSVDATKLADNSVTSVKIADGTIASSDLSTLGAVSPGQILQWNGTSWTAAILPVTPIDVTTQTGVLVGDGTTITGTTAGAGVRGILGSSNNTIGWVTGTPNQILGTNASGDLQFADQSAFISSILNSSQILVGNASNAATAVTMSGDATISNTGTLTIANDAITSVKIADATITGTDIAATTITGNNISALTVTADKLAQSGATNVQVLQWNGTNWVPTSLVADFSTLNIIPKGNGSGLVASQIFDNGTSMGIGTVTPAAKLDLIGTIKITDGSQATGRVLTSDANGLASWQPAGAGSGWTLTGNAGTIDATNFIGTTDNVPLNFRVNNQKSGRIDPVNLNTFLGLGSGSAISTGTWNTGYGFNALGANTIGTQNTAIGYKAMESNTTAGLNVAIGKGALFTISYSNGNVAYGPANTAVGYESLYTTNPTTNSNGARNTAIGYFAGHENTIGQNNIFIGYQAGYTATPANANTNGSNNTFIGYNAGGNSGTLTNATAIGQGAIVNANNKIRLGDTNVTAIEGQVAFTASSDRRLKSDIHSINYGLDFVKNLKPVSYKLNNSDGRENWGFIAQDIEEILGTDKAVLTIGQDEMRTLGLRYTDFIAPMVKAIQEQQDQIEALKDQLKDKDDKVLNLESSVNSMKEELETIKRALGMEANAKSSSKNK